MSENLEPIIADDVVCGKTYYEMNKVDAVISEKNKEINGWKSGYSNLLNVDIPRIETNLKNKIAELEESHKMEVEQLLLSLVQTKKAAQTLRKKMNHQKRQRCMLRSVIAQMNATHYKDLFYDAGSEELADAYNRQITIHYKWHNLWLALADKFKEEA